MTRITLIALSLFALAACESGGLYTSTADSSYSATDY